MSTNDAVNILLVDDQPAKLLSYEVILGELGENLIKAGSAREALEQILKRDIAVVLIDVCMPGLDGYELADMIRGHPRYQTTAIIFVSAVALSDLDRLKGYEHGGVDYVPVPVVPELLRAKVRIFVELYRKSRQLTLLNAELERRVAERTEELATANAELERRVEARTREREAALAQVHEMQKLDSLGQLTGGLAHDFNNLLMAVLTNLDLALKKLPPDASVRRLIESAIQNAERGAMLTRRLLAFARRQELEPAAVDVCGLILSMKEMLQHSLGPAIQVSLEFKDDLALVRVDPNQLELAILNLSLNSRDAMPLGGRLSVGARCAKVEARRRNLEPGDYVCIAVTDTGVGMDETTLKRATEPFFTTKDVGKGTGLGLSMVHGLAAQSGGSMRISSRLGVGTTVELWLPVVESKAADVSPEPRQPPARGARRCRVLLVEDDPDVAASTAALLEDLGHPVLVASSAALALDMIRSDATIELVITDHAMPGLSGAQLVERVRQSNPDLPIILATGFADIPTDDLEVPRLAKPYRREDLARVLSTVVGQELAPASRR